MENKIYYQDYICGLAIENGDGIIVEGDLIIKNEDLTDGLIPFDMKKIHKVTGDFVARNCSDLIELEISFDVVGSVIIASCYSLSELCLKGHIGGVLDLRGCSNLQTFEAKKLEPGNTVCCEEWKNSSDPVPDELQRICVVDKCDTETKRVINDIWGII